jgi:hypothetical protein
MLNAQLDDGTVERVPHRDEARVVVRIEEVTP